MTSTKMDPMTELTTDEAEAVVDWLDSHQFKKVSSVGGHLAPFGDSQEVWNRDGTLVRLTRDRGQWWCDLSRSNAKAWLEMDTIAGVMGFESSTPIDRLSELTSLIDDRVFSALRASVQHPH